MIIFILALSIAIASTLDEARAIKLWLDAPFSATVLEKERDAELSKWQNPQKGEFETTAQFEQRQREAQSRIKAINSDYAQRIRDAQGESTRMKDNLRIRLSELLNQSRETISAQGSLGAYNADKQYFSLSTTQKNFTIVVPLDKAPSVKDNFRNYQLKLIRQLNENLEWEYLEARLEGSLGVFSSTDKAPTLKAVAQGGGFLPPNLNAQISFNEPSGNNILDAEETATITLDLKNTGRGSANMLKANFRLLNAQGVSFTPQIYFGEVKPGETVSKTLQLVAGMDTRDGEAELKIEFEEQNGFPPNPLNLKFQTAALKAPDVYIADIAIDDQSGNNKIEPGEQVAITARIHNRGQGASRNLSARIQLGNDVFSLGNSPTSFNIGELKSGEYKDIVFNIVTARTAKDLDIKIDLVESRSQFSKKDQPLQLAFNRTQQTADQMVIKGQSQHLAVSSAPALSIDIEENIPKRAMTANPKRWGVVIGIENYRNVSPVRFARRDAEYMKDYFVNVLGIAEENIYVAKDEDASLGTLKSVFDEGGWLSKNAGKPENEVFIYFSGHGVPAPDGKDAYLLPYDGNPNYATNSAYDLNLLYANLAKMKSQHITFFLDSCFSGANRENEIILADARPIFISFNPKAKGSNISVFSASGGSQISSSYAQMQHGLFSYFLMKGLGGEADLNNDKKITYKELDTYVKDKVSSQARRMGREQDPELQSSDPTRSIVSW
jgi:hypothetical protein